MKKLGWLLFLVSIGLSAQEVINSAPLSLDPADGRQMVKDEAPVGSLVPAKIDPVDGQLKLGEKKLEEKAVEKEEISIPPRINEEAKLVEPVRFYPLAKYLQFSFGFLNSKWDRVDSSLKNGSTLTDFRVASDMNEHNQLGFAVELIHDTTDEAIPENIRALQYRLFLEHHRAIFPDKFEWLAGVSLSVGDYSIRKFGRNSEGEQVYTKLKSGTLFGIIPSTGMRFYLGGRNSIDIIVEYHQYLSKPQRYIGGFAFAPRFSFAF